MTFRAYLDRLEAADDVLHIEQQLNWSDEVAYVGAEATQNNGPAIIFESPPGAVRPASGVYGGTARMQPRPQKPWSRLKLAVDLPTDYSYQDVLELLASPLDSEIVPELAALEASSTATDLYALGLPSLPFHEVSRPVVTTGLLASMNESRTQWAPVRGLVIDSQRLRLVVPRRVGAGLSMDTAISIALGVPPAALVATYRHWIAENLANDPLTVSATLGAPEVASAAGGNVPASTEVLIDGVVSNISITDEVSMPRAGWEFTMDTAIIEIDIAEISTRTEPIIPFTPLGTSLSDDLYVTGLIKSAQLLSRINKHWSISPVKWIELPPEAGLGICLVSSEILYAGFEWQLANVLFSFSDLFDKVLILDADTPPNDLATALDDMWIKAHPSHNWVFSEKMAPAAEIPGYRSDGETGAQLYINATWDPAWDEEYIAPRVKFDTSFPAEIRETVREHWDAYGFTTDLDDPSA